MPQSTQIAITGAAGQIGYQLAFRIASGQLLGYGQPLTLRLIEIAPAMQALEGVAMELADCAFEPLHEAIITDRLEEGFRGADYVFLVGAKPRGPGMERSDLLAENARIFSRQGALLNEHADERAKVLVVGNPANTNALIASANAPDMDPRNFSAMTRLDHNRACAQLAARTGHHVRSVERMIIWGNHSATQYPDLSQALVDGEPATTLVDEEWARGEFMTVVQQRGAAVIKARGSSSAASAASAAIDHMRDWAHGTRDGDWVSMAVPSDGSYGAPEGTFFSYPVRCADGAWEIVQGLELDEFARDRIRITSEELMAERAAASQLEL
ncbi:malate dehydrogenase [Candidatus Foliamicus sp.]